MNKSKLCLIFNPGARGEKAKIEQVQRLAGHVPIYQSQAAGEAEALSAAAVRAGFDVVVAAGGDGTVNEVVNGFRGRPITLGVLPVGTMNVFAGEIGLPAHDLAKCWEVICQGGTRSLDLALANDRSFVQLAGVGLDAQTLQTTDRDFRRAAGPLAYLASAVQVIRQAAPRLRVSTGNGLVKEGSFLLVGNGRHYGGPFCFFPKARNDDGLLDVLLFQNQGFGDVLRYLQGILLQHQEQMPDLDYFQTCFLQVESDRATPVEMDGEVLLQAPVSFRLAPERLRVLAPRT